MSALKDGKVVHYVAVEIYSFGKFQRTICQWVDDAKLRALRTIHSMKHVRIII